MVNKEKFYIPKDMAESYDGSVLRRTSNELEKINARMEIIIHKNSIMYIYYVFSKLLKKVSFIIMSGYASMFLNYLR
jgi:hypothetical protein